MLSDLVVCYLFLGGTGAGLCLVLSVLGLLVPRSCLSTPPGVHLHPSAAYRKLLGSGLVAAFVLLALGIVCLVADLGNAERMILLLVHPTASYLAVGSWALAACLALAAALGLGEDAGEEQILEALSACIEENKALKEAAEGKKPGDGKQPPEEDTVVANKAVCELLGLKAGAPAAEVAAVIMSLKGGIDGRVKALEEQLADRDAEEAVELALKSGKITPAQKGWAKDYALKSPEGFKSFLEKAPQVVPMSEVAGGEALALKGKKPDEATMLICKQLGVSAEDLEKYGIKEE